MGDPSGREAVVRRLSGHDPAHGHDTGGLPWQGREVTASPFAGDTGAADPRLAAALADTADDAALVAAVAAARLIVPVVAAPTMTTPSARTGLDTDARSDMATVVLTAPDGERALPAFTSTAQLSQWDPTARPVPVTAQSAARAAVEERCDVLVLDVACPHRRVLRISQLWALAQGREWQHAADDPVVRTALDTVVGSEPDIAELATGRADHGALSVTMTLPAGLPRPRVQELAAQVAAALADEDVRIRVDGVTLAVRPA